MPHHQKPPARSSVLSETALLFATATIGAAVIESALVPGILIGGAAWLAPRAFSTLRRNMRHGGGAVATNARRGDGLPVKHHQNHRNWRNSLITKAAAKTVTFRVISSGLDFGWNYLVLGEIGTAAALSGFSIVAAPTFYFLHEALWSRVSLKDGGGVNGQGTFQISGDIGGMKVSKAVAKTVTFRLFATASEFGVNYAVARDLLVATKLSAFSIFVGPFIYLAHERAWEQYEANRPKPPARVPQPLLPGPTSQLVT